MKIYIASKAVHGERWKMIRDEFGYPFISTWIDESGIGQSPDMSDLWQRCIIEASNCDCLIAYREPGEILKGAFIEIGAALANYKPVLTIGCSEFSFINHPLVKQFKLLDSALEYAVSS